MPRVRRNVESTRATASATEQTVKTVVTSRPRRDFSATETSVIKAILTSFLPLRA